jgi:hypothetical protein
MFGLFIMLKGRIRNRNDFFRIRPAQQVRVVTGSGCGPTLVLLRMRSSFCCHLQNNKKYKARRQEELQANIAIEDIAEKKWRPI